MNVVGHVLRFTALVSSIKANRQNKHEWLVLSLTQYDEVRYFWRKEMSWNVNVCAGYLPAHLWFGAVRGWI